MRLLVGAFLVTFCLKLVSGCSCEPLGIHFSCVALGPDEDFTGNITAPFAYLGTEQSLNARIAVTDLGSLKSTVGSVVDEAQEGGAVALLLLDDWTTFGLWYYLPDLSGLQTRDWRLPVFLAGKASFEECTLAAAAAAVPEPFLVGLHSVDRENPWHEHFKSVPFIAYQAVISLCCLLHLIVCLKKLRELSKLKGTEVSVSQICLTMESIGALIRLAVVINPAHRLLPALGYVLILTLPVSLSLITKLLLITFFHKLSTKDSTERLASFKRSKTLKIFIVGASFLMILHLTIPLLGGHSVLTREQWVHFTLGCFAVAQFLLLLGFLFFSFRIFKLLQQGRKLAMMPSRRSVLLSGVPPELR